LSILPRSIGKAALDKVPPGHLIGAVDSNSNWRRVAIENFRAMREFAARIPAWPFRYVLVPVIASRAMLILVAWLGFQLVEKRVLPNIGAWEISNDAGRIAHVSEHVTPNVHPFLNMWTRWDSLWYIEIAKNGYGFKPDSPSTTAFFPLYPICMRLVHRYIKLPNDAGWALSGIMVSNLALVAALCYLVLLIRRDFDETIAARTVLYLSIFPATLFLSAVYTESLFLLVVVSAFYYARKGCWLLAGLIGAAGAVCRAPGFLLILPFGVEYLAQKNFRWREIKIDILPLVLIPLGLVGHIAYLRFRFGEWDIVEQSQAIWGHRFVLLPVTVWKLFAEHHPLAPLNIADVDFAFLFCFLALLVYGALRLRLSYTIFAAVSLFFVTTWTAPNAFSRYGLVIFPFFIALALLGRNETFNRVYLIVSTGLAAFFMLLFSQWGWVA
jgi:Mannosyltransferase (PIG-V)